MTINELNKSETNAPTEVEEQANEQALKSGRKYTKELTETIVLTDKRKGKKHFIDLFEEEILAEQHHGGNKTFWLEKPEKMICICSNDNKYPFKKVDALSDNDLFMDFALSQETGVIDKEKWEDFCLKEKGAKPKNSMPDILCNLGFNGVLKELFFPKSTSKKVKVRKFIREKELREHKLSIDSFRKLLQNKK